MAKAVLSDVKCRTAKPTAKEYLMADGAGLYLRVRPSGAKDWLFVYTFNCKRLKLGLGSYETTSLAVARNEAGKAQDELASLIDPQLSRREREAAQGQKRLAQNAEDARITVKQLFEHWERQELTGRKDKGAEARRSFEKDVFPTLGNVVADDVKRGMVAACLDKIVERGAPVIARNLLGDLRQMFGFAITREFLENDPTSHLKRNDFGTKVERDRVLSEAEIKLLVKKLPDADLQKASIAAVWIMLSTCCRVGEVSQAKWAHIDLAAGTWRIPSDNAKNGKEHTVVLSDFAKAHFEALKALATGKDGRLSDWVLPASRKEGHVDLKSLAKQIGDRQRGGKEPMKNRSKQATALMLERGKWTPHDLRRTGATLMGALGVRPDVIEKCLNHIEQNRLVRIYQRQTLVAEQAEAWRLLGGRLELLTRVDSSNVVLPEISA